MTDLRKIKSALKALHLQKQFSKRKSDVKKIDKAITALKVYRNYEKSKPRSLEVHDELLLVNYPQIQWYHFVATMQYLDGGIADSVRRRISQKQEHSLQELKTLRRPQKLSEADEKREKEIRGKILELKHTRKQLRVAKKYANGKRYLQRIEKELIRINEESRKLYRTKYSIKVVSDIVQFERGDKIKVMSNNWDCTLKNLDFYDHSGWQKYHRRLKDNLIGKDSPLSYFIYKEMKELPKNKFQVIYVLYDSKLSDKKIYE